MPGYAYCWTKNSTNLLKETEDLSSKRIKVTNMDVLNNLKKTTSNLTVGDFGIDQASLMDNQ